MTFQRTVLATLSLATALSMVAGAQAPSTPQPPKASDTPKASETPASTFAERHPYGPMTLRVFVLKNILQQQDGNEILVTLRNTIDPRDRLTYAPSQNAIVMDAPVEELAKAEKIISELDKPKKAYRLTYTLIDLDGTKRVGDQHYSMALVPGQRTVLKQGNKVPINTGDKTAAIQQFTYLDVGLSFDATLDDSSASNIRLRTKVDQNFFTEGANTAQPIIRVASYEGSAFLTLGKPLTIGSLDLSGTTRRTEIQVTAEPLAQ
ncbi:MAG: hypothetical protein JST61_02970 [Acidobacteria bacterium]|nr:hypothetical protein [Acidobacteriota bacterium]